MTDIRTAAQADQLSAPEIPTWLIEADVSRVWGIAWESAIKHAIERQALAEPVEPVAWIQNYKGDFNNLFKAESKEFVESMARQNAHYTYLPLYTTPPSVAVEPVAEIVRNETGQIRLVDSNGDSFDVSKHIGTKLYTTPPSVDALIADLMELHLTWEDYQDVKEVCDKYRRTK